MSQRGLLFADGYFPFAVLEKYPHEGSLHAFAAWDGSTFFVEGANKYPSAISDWRVPAVGPATPWPVGLTREEFCVFYWLARRWKLSIENLEEVTLSVDASESGGLSSAAGGTATPSITTACETRVGERTVGTDPESGEPPYVYLWEEVGHEWLVTDFPPSKLIGTGAVPLWPPEIDPPDIPIEGIDVRMSATGNYSAATDTSVIDGSFAHSSAHVSIDVAIRWTGWPFYGLSLTHVLKDGLYYPLLLPFISLTAGRRRYAVLPPDPPSVDEWENIHLDGSNNPAPEDGEATAYQSTMKLKLRDQVKEFPITYWSPQLVRATSFPIPHDGTLLAGLTMPIFVLEPTEYWSHGGIYDTETGMPV